MFLAYRQHLFSYKKDQFIISYFGKKLKPPLKSWLLKLHRALAWFLRKVNCGTHLSRHEVMR